MRNRISSFISIAAVLVASACTSASVSPEGASVTPSVTPTSSSPFASPSESAPATAANSPTVKPSTVKPSTGSSFTIKFLAVGQGDSALYRGPCGQIGLLDANKGASAKILASLDAWKSRKLAWIAVSHYDSDHVGDVVTVAGASGVSVGAVYDRGGNRSAKSTAIYGSYYDWVTSKPGLRRSVDIGKTFSLCSGSSVVKFTVLSNGTDGTAAGGMAVSDENDRSLCLKVEYKEFDMATCGDIGGADEGSRADVESAVASTMGNVEVVKVNHHGSKYSSNATWVSKLKAQMAIISVGKNSYGHPDPNVVSRWKSSGSVVYQTQSSADGSPVNGDVTVTTTGTVGFTVTTSAQSGKKSFLTDEEIARRQ